MTLEFFWYQDYDREGCPFDCSVPGNCQLTVTGEGESPLGNVTVADNFLGAEQGARRFTGSLAQGSYTASFRFTGGRGSINIGLKVVKRPIMAETLTPPTETPAPELTPTGEATPTATLTGTPITTVLPPGDTPTPTATSVPPEETATPTATSEPPDDTTTRTPTDTPTDPPVETVLPPDDTPTPTSTREEGTPPATLAPPGATRTPALVPVTGIDRPGPSHQSAFHGRLFPSLGIAGLGLGLVFHGLGRRLS